MVHKGGCYIDPFPETICDNGKYVIYLVTKLRLFFFACSRDIIVDCYELLISPVDYHYKICAFPKRFDDINKSILFFYNKHEFSRQQQ